MKKKYFINRIYISKQDKLYNVKAELQELGLLWNTKENHYYNKYEISKSSMDAIMWICKKNDFSYELKKEEYEDITQRLQSQYKILSISELTFAIVNRKDDKYIYIISVYKDVLSDTVNILDNKNAKHFSFVSKVSDSKNTILAIYSYLQDKEHEFKENIIDFDFDGFLLKMSVLLSEFTNEKDVYGKINKFKYYMISKLSDNVFLCNSVKGFFPETSFYLNKGKITSSYSKNNLNKEQENKIWKFLYYNRDRVAVEHKPSLWELFVNNRVSVSIDGFETKMPICDVKWNNGNIIVHVFNGNKKVSLNKTFRKEELWAEVLKNR